jgi:hypothetical protein
VTVPSMDPFAACDCPNADVLSRTAIKPPINPQTMRM